MTGLLTSRVSAVHLFTAFAGGVLLVFAGMKLAGSAIEPPRSSTATAARPVCELRMKRATNYRGISPLLAAEADCESQRLAPVKNRLQEAIERRRVTGELITASIYLYDLSRSEWTVINDAERFEPGSLIKVPLMMALMRMDEERPGTMARLIRYDDPPAGAVPAVHFPPVQPLRAGDYTIGQLVEAAIVHSDNGATWSLNHQVDEAECHRAFTDLQLRDYVSGQQSYLISAREYATFFKALYNGTYLSLRDSEKAIDLLLRSEFRIGMAAGLPPGTPFAHKFGEAQGPGVFQLHEAGIVYIEKRPYLVVAMTSGPDMQRLPAVLKELASEVYSGMMAL